MCLGVPGKVLTICREDGLLMGQVEFGGLKQRVCLEHTPQVQPGQYVIVHVGFALQVLDAEQARQIFDTLRRMGAWDELPGPAEEVAAEGQPGAAAELGP